MDARRRTITQGFSAAAVLRLLAGAGLAVPGVAVAERNRTAFEAKTLGEALRALAPSAPRGDSAGVKLIGPDIAENGAAVSISVASSLPGTTLMAVLVERNPNPLAAVFTIAEGTEPSLSTRIKMSQTANVHALVQAEGRFHLASREIKVIVGGCDA